MPQTILIITMIVSSLVSLIAIIPKAIEIFQRNDSSKKYEYKVTNDLFMHWKNGSIPYKIECAVSIIYLLSVDIFLFVMFFVADIIDWLVNHFFKMSEEQAIEFLTTDLVKYFAIFMGAILGISFVTMIISTISYFDLAKWIKKNNIDCLPLLKTKSNKNIVDIYVGNAYLINESPASKKLLCAKLIIIPITGALLIFAFSLFIKSFIITLYEGFEVHNLPEKQILTSVFTSPEAIFSYISLALALTHIILEKIIRNNQKKLVAEYVESTKERKLDVHENDSSSEEAENATDEDTVPEESNEEAPAEAAASEEDWGLDVSNMVQLTPDKPKQ